MFGLSDNELKEIKEIIKANGETKAILFGSRAKGNYKKGSDIDIAVDKNEKIISYKLNEESNLIYYFDIINIKKISNQNLINHINRVGINLLEE